MRRAVQQQLGPRAAQNELGATFDIRTFHDGILNGGALPCYMLDARTSEEVLEGVCNWQLTWRDFL